MNKADVGKGRLLPFSRDFYRTGGRFGRFGGLNARSPGHLEVLRPVREEEPGGMRQR